MIAPEAVVPPGATELPDQYVAAFGKDAALGCFTAAEAICLSRHDRVLLQTPRGLEVGEILTPATIRQARLLGAQVHGQLIRPINADDDGAFTQMARLAEELLIAAEDIAQSSVLGLAILDAEVMFDLRHALLHVLHPNPDALADFTAAVSVRTGLIVRLTNLALPAEKDHGCGKPDCGEGGGGGCSTCSDGGCATGCGTGVSAPPDLRPYFAHLREQMETQRIPLV